jgi:hypothetical protein
MIFHLIPNVPIVVRSKGPRQLLSQFYKEVLGEFSIRISKGEKV